MAAGGKNRRFLIWLAIGTALLALATAALLTFLLNQRQLIAESRSLQTDSITALTHQAEREFMRYRQTLDAAVNSRKPPDDEALTLRHDIFLSRVNLLRENGPIGSLDQRPIQPACLARHRQSYLATPFRQRLGLQRQRLRPPG